MVYDTLLIGKYSRRKFALLAHSDYLLIITFAL